MTTAVAVEFSRKFETAELTDDETVIEIEANADERARLAERFELMSLDLLSARLTVKPYAGLAGGEGGVRVEGRLTADVVQACVVTLEPVHAHIDAPFSRTYSPDAPDPLDPDVLEDEPEGEEGGMFIGEGSDPPEPLIGGGIDLGEAVAEQLALELDPFPRAEGAALPQAAGGPESSENRGENGRDSAANPFAVLKKLKK